MQQENNKILFTLSSYQQYKSYIQTGALKEISERIIFLVNPKLIEMNLDFGVYKERVIPYTYPDRKNTLHRHVFNLNSFINRRKHHVFWTRTQWFSKRQKQVYRLLAWPLINQITKFLFLQRAKDSTLTALVKKINPAIILLPSHAFDGMTFELIRIAKQLKRPSLMIVENWDTLSTKTIFTFNPDYLGVWSQQQIEHTVEIRNFPRERTFIIGTPKYTKFIKEAEQNHPSPYPFRYALFIGMPDLFDELGALRRMDQIIEKNKIDLTIVYRPTPTQHTRNCPDVFFEYDFKHVILDTPAKAYYKKSATWDMSDAAFNPVHFPDSTYYPGLLANMEFMVCAHSTMILRSTLFHKPVYLLAYNDGVHAFGGPDWAYATQRHLFGVERLANVRMVYKLEDIEKIFLPGDQLRPKESAELLAIDFFVSQATTLNYPANLRKVVDSLIGKTN